MGEINPSLRGESFADAQDGSKGAFVVILNEGCRSEGSTRSDFFWVFIDT